uniref:Uncharacterized protein n=1 Tax=Arundo donax TaxID=35708 RepID=A0A0A9DF87_ARUDO
MASRRSSPLPPAVRTSVSIVQAELRGRHTDTGATHLLHRAGLGGDGAFVRHFLHVVCAALLHLIALPLTVALPQSRL